MSQHRNSVAAFVVGVVLFAGFVSCTADHSAPASVAAAPVVATTAAPVPPITTTTATPAPSWEASELGSSPSSSYSDSRGSSSYSGSYSGSGGSSSSSYASGGYGDTYTNSDGNQVERPDSNSSGATAVCKDGTDSHSQHHKGTCSGHGGVARWL